MIVKQRVFNSGLFESLDATSHWANHIQKLPGVVSLRQIQVLRKDYDGVLSYRVVLLCDVTENHYNEYINATTDR